jgi:glycosyltransferase involved in cell wall biosynthesis
LVDAVVGVSRFVIDSHLNNGLFKNAQFKQVIYNTRSLIDLPKEVIARPRLPIRFGFMGTLTPSKGIELLLEFFIKVKNNNAELFVAGSGKLYYEEMLKERFSTPRIHFLEYVPTGRFFPQIDALIVPSLCHDSLPGVVFESLAYGVPVIASNRGGIPEMIQHGVNGFLFDPYCPGQLESTIRRVTKDRNLIEAMRETCISTAKPFLNIEKWTDKWEALYGKVSGLSKEIEC